MRQVIVLCVGTLVNWRLGELFDLDVPSSLFSGFFPSLLCRPRCSLGMVARRSRLGFRRLEWSPSHGRPGS